MNSLELYQNFFSACVYYVKLNSSTQIYPTSTNFVNLISYDGMNISIVQWNQLDPAIQPDIPTLQSYTVAQVQRAATEFYAQLDGTKLGIDIYNSSAITIKSISYIDINKMGIQTIDYNNFGFPSDVNILIYNPGSYSINGKLNISVPSGTATTFNVSYRLVYSTDATNYNDMYPQPATMTLSVNRTSSASNSYSSTLPLIYNTNYANTYIKMQIKTSNATIQTKTIPFSTGCTITEL